LIVASSPAVSYPSDLVVDAYVNLPAPVTQTIVVAYADGSPARFAQMSLAGGGPTPITTPVPLTADVNGRVTLPLQYNSNAYTVAVAAQAPSPLAPIGWAAPAVKSFTVGSTPAAQTVNVTVSPPSPVSQVLALKLADGSPAKNTSVTVSGNGTPQTLPTDLNGLVSFSLQASANPYTVSVAAQVPSVTAPYGSAAFSTQITVNPAPTTQPITLALPAPVNQLVQLKFPDGSPVVGASITISGGTTSISGITDGSGRITFTPVQPWVSAYTVTVATQPRNLPTVPIGWAAPPTPIVVTQSPTPLVITVVPQ
jgi:hypothetical protein